MTRKRTFTGYLKLYFFIFTIIILFVNIPIYLYSAESLKKNENNNLTNSVEVVLKDLEQKSNAIDRFISWTVANDENYQQLAPSTGFSNELTQLRRRTSDLQVAVGPNFYFFVRFPDRSFINASSVRGINFQDYLAFKKSFDDLPNQPRSFSKMWQAIQLNNKDYYVKSILYQQKELICLVEGNTLLMPLKNLDLGINGNMSLSSAPSLSKKTSSLFDSANHLVFSGETYTFPFYLNLTIDRFNTFKGLQLFYLVMLLTIVSAGGLLWLFFRHSQRALIQPLEQFVQNIKHITAETPEVEAATILADRIEISEFDDIRLILNSLLTEIETLKIEMYEQELQRQKIEFDFLKTQIRPHFYLNCLTTIYNMYQTEHYPEMEQFIISTSKYFRYLFKNDGDQILLADELAHLNDYISIYSHQLGNVFSFKTQINADLLDQEIPVLMLDTFVENLFKYGVNASEHTAANLIIDYATEEKNTFNIAFSDTGPGFPEDVLTQFQTSTIQPKDGHGIGINNVYQRLRLLHGTNFSMKLTNGHPTGARIDIILPIRRD